MTVVLNLRVQSTAGGRMCLTSPEGTSGRGFWLSMEAGVSSHIEGEAGWDGEAGVKNLYY